MNTVTLKKALVCLEVKETVLVLAGSVILPFLIHLIPPIAGIPLGARLLPMFYAPLIAIVLFRAHVGIIAALFAPALNSLLTGHPLPEKVGILTFELLIFCIILYLLNRQWKEFWAAAPLAYLLALACASAALGSMNFFFTTLSVGIPGFLALALLNLSLLNFKSKREWKQ